jgi:hypothetical protein
MAIKVSVPSSKVKVSVPSSNPRLVSTVATGSKRVTSAKVEQLANVDSTDGLQDGYTLIYDESSGKWVAQELNISAALELEFLDGGTY